MAIDLKSLLANPGFSRREKLLILLAASDPEEMTVSQLKELAREHGLGQIKKWNVSQVLKSLGESATRLPCGWSLTEHGKARLKTLGVLPSGPAAVLQPTLRKHVSGITDPAIRAFAEEAIGALENKLFRSAVVLSWVGALSILYEHVLVSHLASFNAEAIQRFPKWKDAKTADDLALMKEHDFVQILQAISVIGKNTKTELEHCLKLRNACGHPNSHIVGEHRVSAHLETLILNVYARFSV